ncbi:hypothetical protein BH24ACT9_BH24ACT9_01460 [soil metagenome]|jgi:hypothetical protein
MATQYTYWNPRTPPVVQQASPDAPPLPYVQPVPHLEPVRHLQPVPQIQPEPLTPRELFVQRLVGSALMLVLLSVTGYLWNIDWLFRVLFTIYTVLTGYWFWDLFVRKSHF